jgi:hypothetical protein
MAGKSASILVKILGDESGFRKSLGGAGDGLDTFSKKMDAQGAKMQNVGAKMTAGITLPLVALGAVAVKNFMEAEKAQAQLEASIASTGATAWTSVEQMDALASSMQKKFAVDGDLVKSGASLLLTFTKVKNGVGEGNDVFDRATETAVDMSRKLGMDLPAANMLLGKSLNDPIRGMGALRKAGVQLTEQQQAQVEAFVASGDIMGAQKVILGELETQFAGSAAAYAETTEGQLEAAKLALEDVSEEIGAKLVPMLTAMGEGLVGALDKWDSLGDGTQNFILVLAGAAAALGPVTTVVGTLMRAGEALSGLRGRLTQVTTTADGSYTSLTRAGRAAALIGAAGAVLGVVALINALNGLNQSAERTQDELNALKLVPDGDTFSAGLAALDEYGDSLTSFMDKASRPLNDDLAIGDGLTASFVNVKTGLENLAKAGEWDQLETSLDGLRNAATLPENAAIKGELDGLVAGYSGMIEREREVTASADAAAASQGELAGSLGETGAAVEDVASELVAAAPGFDTFMSKISATGAFADALSATLDQLFGPKMGLEEAAAGWEAALDKLSESIKTNGATLDIGTDKGRANREMLVSNTEASFALLEAEVAAGMGAEEAAGRHKMRTENLIAEAIQGGFTEQQVRDLIGTYGDVPADVITRAQFQAIQAKIDAKDLTGAAMIYDAMTPEAKAQFERTAATADVQAIKGELDRLDGRVVTAQIRVMTTSAQEQATRTRKKLDGVRAAGGPMSAGGTYLVGEEGPELVVPKRAGTVIPAGKTKAMFAAAADAGTPLSAGAGGGSVVVNVNFSGPVANDAVGWVVDAVETAVAKGMQMPKLRRSLVG